MSEIVKLVAITFTHRLFMSFILPPWQLLLMILARWVHREQQAIIAFYQVELDALMKAEGMVHVRANRVVRAEIVLTARCSRHAQTTNSLRADPNLVLECSE